MGGRGVSSYSDRSARRFGSGLGTKIDDTLGEALGKRGGSRRVLARQPEGQTRIIHLPSPNTPRIASAPSWPMSFDAADTMSSRSLRIDRIRWVG